MGGHLTTGREKAPAPHSSPAPAAAGKRRRESWWPHPTPEVAASASKMTPPDLLYRGIRTAPALPMRRGCSAEPSTDGTPQGVAEHAKDTAVAGGSQRSDGEGSCPGSLPPDLPKAARPGTGTPPRPAGPCQPLGWAETGLELPRGPPPAAQPALGACPWLPAPPRAALRWYAGEPHCRGHATRQGDNQGLCNLAKV